MTYYVLIYLLIGLLAGFASGLFGIGGGIIIVPALTLLFARFYFSNQWIMPLATGTSLAAMSIIIFISALTHHRFGHLKKEWVLRIIPGMILGSIFGVYLAGHLPAQLIRWAFTLFLVAVALSILFKKTLPLASEQPHVLRHSPIRSPAGLMFFLLCWGIGVIAGGLGIGGGVLLMPLLLAFQLPFAQATATTVACVLPTVLVGAISAAAIGFYKVGLPAYTTGFIYWPAVGCIGLAALLGAPLGAHLSRYLPVLLLKRGFAIILLLVAWKMGYRT